MKTAAILLASLFIAAILFSSCKTQEKCPAYGEVDQFKKEKRY